MSDPSVGPLLQAPQWWYETWGLADWLGTLFDQPLEVHAFLLGGCVGVVLATLAVRRHPRTALAFTLVVALFTFGALETVIVCSDAFTACQHVRLKPWYFLGGFVAVHLGAEVLLGTLTDRGPIDRLADRDSADSGPRTVANTLAGVVVVALLGATAYSFVSSTPVHPITGLATIGGLLGSTLGLAAFHWALADADTRFVAVARRILGADRDDSLLYVGYGTVLGFGYPRTLWELGSLVGTDGFLFGDVTWATNGLPSVVAYVAPLFTLGLLSIRVRRRDGDTDHPRGRLVAALVLGFVTYAACLFVLTGYAGHLWFRIVPSA